MGDYTRLLAGTLIQQGHQIACIALNDRRIGQVLEGTDSAGFPYLRLPASKGWAKRAALASAFVNGYAPEVISLQFAPYPYQKKGCPVMLGHWLKKIGNHCPWHIMFHEMWVGKETLKLRIYASVQKKIIQDLLQTLNPITIHTQLPVHMKRLQDLGYKPCGLPLFSNIPYVEQKISTKSAQYLTVAFFSQFAFSDPILFALRRLNNLAHSQDKKLKIIVLGGRQLMAKKLVDILAEKMHKGVAVEYMGNHPATKISAILQSVDIGISPIHRSFIGKSGTVAAFANNGIPVTAPIGTIDKKEKGFLMDNIDRMVMKSVDLYSYNLAQAAAKTTVNSLNPYKIAFQLVEDIGKKMPTTIPKIAGTKKEVS